MKSALEKQLLRFRESIIPARQRSSNSHWRTAESLNLIRERLLDLIAEDERETWRRLVVAIDVRRPEGNGGEYTASSEDTLRLCDQLLSIVEDGTAAMGNEAHSLEGSLSRVVPLTKRIFLIHGHDTVNTFRLSSLLQTRFQADAVVLSEQPGKGRVLLEKFEDEAGLCGFAFALLTADDLIAARQQEYRQSRPNVLFELGWFYGRLGRSRVCILHQNGTSIPSDLAGIARIAFRDSVEESLGEIELELKAAGMVGQQ